jgi:hypothetical protein
MTSPIETLVQQLNGDDDASYTARVQLVGIGRDATLTITDGLPTLSSFGQLTRRPLHGARRPLGQGCGKRLDYPNHTPTELRRWTDLHCNFADG